MAPAGTAKVESSDVIVNSLRLGCSGKSAAVITDLTPGSAAALDVSIDLISAWACGLRRTLPISWPDML